MIRPRAQLAALVAGVALLSGAGCGSEEDEPGPGIPREAASRLSAELDAVQRRLDYTREESAPGACGDIDSESYPDMQRILDGLPGDTDPDVRRALQRSIDRLKELTESECSELIEEIEKRRDETTPPVTTPPPPPPPPQTTPQETETEEEPEEKEPKERKPKKDKDQEDGGTGPNGQGPPGQNGGGQPAPPANDG